MLKALTILPAALAVIVLLPAAALPATNAADTNGPAVVSNASVTNLSAPDTGFKPPAFLRGIIDFTVMGGFFMYPLYLLSILGVAYLLERQYSYMKKKPYDDVLLKLCKGVGTMKQISARVAAVPSRMGDAIAEVVRLSQKRKTIEELDKVLEMGVNIHVSEMQKGFTILSAVINLAPLVGFLGTVSGMIDAFRKISAADQVSITVVAKGIYEALITTEVGLVIAIVVNFFYSLYVQNIEKFTQGSIEAGERLIERIVDGGMDGGAGDENKG